MFASKKMRFNGSYIKSRARSYARSHARLYNHRSYNYGVTIAFLFGISFDKRVIVKSYLQLGKKPFNLIRKQEKN